LGELKPFFFLLFSFERRRADEDRGSRFNEPDLEGQAWMTVDECLKGWKDHLQPFAKKGLKLVSPAVTNGRSFTVSLLTS